ncbi:MAG: hypothetical protein WBD81_17815 [Collimonas pratensis]|uniref:hypothetical protein n=1 Tax=Collimonas pratensis TaxID=279113 RepID=UPI003C71D006
MNNTERIFSGVRAFNEGGWCYTGRPKTWYVKEDLEVPFQEGLIFAVYLNPLFKIYEFRAEKSAIDDSGCPENWEDRYGGLIWKNIS